MNTSFRFCSTYFNITEPQDYFINPGCFGEDLAVWLIEKLNDSGINTTTDADQEDYGWFFNFTVNGVEHSVIVGFQPNDLETGDCWIGWIERNVGGLRALLGGRHRGILPGAVKAIDSALRSATEISDLEWSDDSN